MKKWIAWRNFSFYASEAIEIADTKEEAEAIVKAEFGDNNDPTFYGSVTFEEVTRDIMEMIE